MKHYKEYSQPLVPAAKGRKQDPEGENKRERNADIQIEMRK